MKAVGQDTPAEKKRASSRSEEKSALALFLEGRSNSGGANHNVFLMLKQFNGRDAAPQASEGLSRLEYAFDDFSDVSWHASAVWTSQRREGAFDFPFQLRVGFGPVETVSWRSRFSASDQSKLLSVQGSKIVCAVFEKKKQKKSSKATGFGRINHWIIKAAFYTLSSLNILGWIKSSAASYHSGPGRRHIHPVRPIDQLWTCATSEFILQTSFHPIFRFLI